MTWHDYQTGVERTLKSDHRVDMKVLAIGLGLCGEAGEVAELLKKQYLHGRALDLPKLAEELGDVLWYVSALCSMHGLNLGDVAAWNLEKLRARYPDGFKPKP